MIAHKIEPFSHSVIGAGVEVYPDAVSVPCQRALLRKRVAVSMPLSTAYQCIASPAHTYCVYCMPGARVLSGTSGRHGVGVLACRVIFATALPYH